MVKPRVAKVGRISDLTADSYNKGSRNTHIYIYIAKYSAQSMVGDFAETDMHLDISTKGALVRAQLTERS
eukprot:8947500-Pyramimonas_sp.AAC.1